MIRLFPVDDHAVLRADLRTLFEQAAELQVAGAVESGEQLLALRMPKLARLAELQQGSW